MEGAFKKKKDDTVADLTSRLNFLLGSETGIAPSEPTVLSKSLIMKGAMFWDSKGRMQRVKSLNLSSMGLEQFEDVYDFEVEELTSIELLSLAKNKIVHLQGLSVLQTLLTLNISHNQVYDISPLRSLNQLQELYANNNSISSIEPLECLSSVKVLHLYNNKIAKFETTITVLAKLSQLEDLDIEENPCYSLQVKKDLLRLPLRRLNNDLVTSGDRESPDSPQSSALHLSTSCVITPLNMSTLRDTKTSFFQPKAYNDRQKMHEKLVQLKEDYAQLDDQFEEEIVKNVHLKAQLAQAKKAREDSENKKQDNSFKLQEIQNMKRQSRDLKEQLFTKDKKGELLRRLFQLETQPKKKQKVPQKAEAKPKKVVWQRRFDADEVIAIENKDSKYLDDDEQLSQLLDSNNNFFEEMKRELREYTE